MKPNMIFEEFFSVQSFIEWKVLRRYSEFEKMHQVLHKMFASDDFPQLPPKSGIMSNATPQFIEQRLNALQLYLQRIINVTHFQVDDFFAFFDMHNANRVFSVGTNT